MKTILFIADVFWFAVRVTFLVLLLMPIVNHAIAEYQYERAHAGQQTLTYRVER